MRNQNRICAAKHGRGIANSHVFFCGRDVRGDGPGSREMLPPFSFSLGFGSCPTDGTHKLLTTACEKGRARLVRETRRTVLFCGNK